jgi:hypothetical protein
MRPVEQLAASGYDFSVLYADGTAQHWHYYTSSLGWVSEALNGGAGGITKVSAGGAYITAAEPGVSHWNMYCCSALGQRELLPGETGYSDVAGDTRTALALTDKGRVIAGQQPSAGLASGPDWLPPDLYSSRAVAIDSWDGTDAAITDTGQVYVWGNDAADLQPPGDLCPARSVKLDGVAAVVCQDGTVRVWGGSTADSRRAVPADLSKISQVAVGTDYVMALTTAGDIVAWGDGARSAPTGLSKVHSISAGLFNAAGR